jgi:hypothetical protein
MDLTISGLPVVCPKCGERFERPVTEEQLRSMWGRYSNSKRRVVRGWPKGVLRKKGEEEAHGTTR